MSIRYMDTDHSDEAHNNLVQNSIVETHNVTKTYQQNDIKVHALQDVTLNIDAGEFTVMVGPSGSGKTTLLNHIGALDVPTSGDIRIDGQLLNDLSRSALTKLRLWMTLLVQIDSGLSVVLIPVLRLWIVTWPIFR